MKLLKGRESFLWGSLWFVVVTPGRWGEEESGSFFFHQAVCRMLALLFLCSHFQRVAFPTLTSLFNLFPQECEKAGMAIIDSYHKHVEVDTNKILSYTDHREPDKTVPRRLEKKWWI